MRSLPRERGPVSTPAAEQADIGILFVHGIGTQRRGWTLSEFGGPVYDWIRRWIGKVHRGRSAAGVTTAGVGEWAKERLDPTWEQAPPEVKARRLAVLRQ